MMNSACALVGGNSESGFFYYLTQAEALRKRACALVGGYGEMGMSLLWYLF